MNDVTNAVPGSRFSGLIKTIGPGILFAGAAIGGSHLVWSTRAGATYGWTLVWAILLVNLFKYPFFEFSHRYTVGMRESILEGYARLGRGSVWTILVICLISGVVNITGVTVITAVLAGYVFAPGLDKFWWSLIIAGICIVLLFAGHYRTLDRVVKVVVAALALSTVVALGIALGHGPNAQPDAVAPAVWSAAGIAFLISLMGWMPAPIDVGLWPSIWAIERARESGHLPTRRERMADFHIGYVTTVILALCFLGLGVLVMFGTGEEIAGGGIPFAKQLIDLYTQTLGEWSRWLIALAALTCMYSTTITCFDGYTRTVHAALCLAVGRENVHREDKLYWAIMLSFLITTLLMIGLLKSFLVIIVMAAVLGFLTAPVVAVINYRAVTARFFPVEFRPGIAMRTLSWLGFAFLAGFSILYFWVQGPTLVGQFRTIIGLGE